MADLNEKGFYLASFSSRGPTKDNRVKPELAAPGVAVMAARAGTGNGYVSHSGTSMATPFVSGAVALMLDAKPSLTPAQVLEHLRQSAVDWGSPGQDIDYGWGRLDAYEAVRLAGGHSGTGPAVPGHRLFEGSLAGTGQQAEHQVSITAPGTPLAVTLIMREWAGRSSPDFDLFVYGPEGGEVGKSTGTTRQETVTVTAAAAGTYRIVEKLPKRPCFRTIRSRGCSHGERCDLHTVVN
jgi:serine protease AprX